MLRQIAPAHILHLADVGLQDKILGVGGELLELFQGGQAIGRLLHSGQEVAVDEEVRIEVLKAAPQAEDFAWERTDGDELEVSFTLTDPDSALLGGALTITQGDAVLLTQPLVPGKNEAAVGLFLQEKIGFCEIADRVAQALSRVPQGDHRDLDAILAADQLARKIALQ